MKKFGIIPFIIFIFIHTFTVQAQITLDGTCGVSGVLEGPDFKIEAGMGKEYGNNLFHSFGKFNINTGETAIFYGPESVTNIITRVTGGSQSWIDGSLKSDIAGANLFLLNPSGIMFGPNASLDISGSFHMNTAEYLRFEDGVKFDAVYPQNNLLTLAAPTAFGFLKENPAHIAVKGDIKVQQCKAISLTAGNIDITGGTLEAQNGQINITSTGETAANGNIIINKGSVFADGGQISISGTSSGKEIPLAYADNMAFEGYGKISISNASDIDVSGESSGEIKIQGNELNIEKSFINSYTRSENGGRIDIQLKGDMKVSNEAQIATVAQGMGNAGDIVLNLEKLEITGRGMVFSNSQANGKSGDILVNAHDSVSISGNLSMLSTNAFKKGDAGNVAITTDILSLNHNGAISAKAHEEGGTGGNISIAAGNITVTNNSEINTSSEKGKSGNITLAVNHLAVSGNGKISTGEKKASSGNIDIISGGNIDITAKDSVIISGNGNLLAQAKGKTENDHTGNIRISAPVITFKDNGVITNDTFGPASGGNIILNGDRLDMNKGYISSSTEGTGKGGSVSITAKQSVNISGSETGEPGLHGIYYGIYSQAKPEASGSGGNISISANELNIANDAWINGQAYGGDSGGNVTLEVNHLNINKGGTISTSTRGKGSSGNINITAAESVNILGPGIVTDKSLKSFVYASTHSSGQGGNITISSPVLVVGKYGALETDTLGGGTSDGNILEHGTAGKIALDVDLFELRDGGKVSAETLSVGRGGDIEIKTEKLVLYNDALITAKSSGSGDAGDILINADDTIRIEKSALKTKADNADGGNITVNTQNMLNITDSDITAEVGGGEGNGGNITMNPKLAVVDNSQITADAYKGNGGNIRVVSDGFIQSSDSRVSASSELGIDGSIEIESADIGEDLTVLPADFLDAAQWIKTPCSERSGEKVGSFVMAGRDGLPTPLDDWLASPPFPFDKDGKSEKQGTDSLWQLLFKGEELYFKGDFSNAVQLWEQAMNLLDPGKRAYFHTLIYLSDAYQALGHYQSALSSLNKALTIVEKNDTPYLNALFFSSLGNIALCFGNLTEAEEYLEKGIKEARLANNPNVLANVLNILGNVLAVDGDYQGAMSAYEKSLDIIDHSAGVIHDLAMLKSKILINIAHAKFMKGDYEEAVTLMGDALLQIINLPDSHQKASDFVSLSLLAQKIRNRHTQSGNQFKDIIFRALNKARRLAEKLGDTRIVSYACGYLAQLYEEENRYSETVSLTREALFFAQQGNCPEILYLWQWQLGRLLKLEGYIEKSVKAYNDAINTLKPIRKEFFIGYRSKKNIFYEKVKPVYLGLAELLLKQAENKVGKHQEDKLKQAMNTMELLKAAELQDYFEDECVTAKHKKFIEPDNIPSHTAVIYPILFPDHLTLLLTLPKGMKQVNVPVNSEKLRKKAKRFRERLQEFSKKNRVLHYAKPLYECLIRPVEAELTAQEIDTVIVAPDGVLRLIPFSALYDGNHFLVENYAIVTVPAITLTDSEPIDSDNARVLLNGLSEARQGFSPLPNVEKELKTIEKIMDGKAVTVLKSREFTNDNLNAEFKNYKYSVVHMATHGSFGNTPQATFLLTYDGKLTINGLEKLINIGRFRDEQVNLLTLSACDTAMGDELAALGLGGIALKAGVKSAIATLWHIDDKAASMVITEFYRGLGKPGQSKAEALQNAQKKLISNSEYNHPAYWSPFLMIGNWK